MAKFVIFDLLGSIVWFPIWWYTTGFRRLFHWAMMSLSYRAKSYGFSIWIRNFFVPMYGQRDIAGRLISVGMRFFVLIGRAIAIGVEALVYLGALLVWLATPFVIVLFIVVNLTTRLSV